MGTEVNLPLGHEFKPCYRVKEACCETVERGGKQVMCGKMQAAHVGRKSWWQKTLDVVADVINGASNAASKNRDE